MRRVVLTILLLLCAASAAAQEVLGTANSVRASYPTPMSKAQLSDMLNRIVAQHPGWALLRKDSGNNCPTPYPGVSISCDWVVHAGTRWGYDILRDQEGSAVITQSDGAALSAGQELVYPWPVDGGTSPTPTPNPTPTQPAPTLQVDYERLRTLMEQAVKVVYDQNERIFAQSNVQHAETLGVMKKHDEEPMWITRRLKDWKTYLTVGSVLGGWLLRGTTSSTTPAGAQ